jgi:hypothetical protein
MTFARLKAISERRIVWTIGLYELDGQDEVFSLSEKQPFLCFGQEGLRLDRNYRPVHADPFLFAHGGRLYVFHEIKTDFGVGEIHARSMDAQGSWVDHGQVLKEEFHLSYPQVLSHGDRIWMVPETASDGKVWLYAAENFPLGWHRVRTLVDEALVDPSIIQTQEGIFLLGTTRKDELKIFFAKDIQAQFVTAGLVITDDRLCSRNAGAPFFTGDSWYRCAQNCRDAYGQNILLLRIDDLSVDRYAEHIAVSDLFPDKPGWMKEGHHHLSMASFNGKCYAAVDGMRKDRYLNTLLLGLMKVFAR